MAKRRKRKHPEREIALAWAAVMKFALENSYNFLEIDEYQPELAEVMLKAQALRCALQLVCERHGEDMEAMISVSREAVYRVSRERNEPSRASPR